MQIGKERRRAAARRLSLAAARGVARSDALEQRLLLAGNGLVAAFGFEEGAGVSSLDISGNNNNASISGATWTTTGKFGKALTFDGASNLVSVADAASLDLTTGMTLEAWILPTITTGVRDVMIKEGSNVDIYNLYHRNGAGRPEINVLVSGDNRTAQGNALANNTWAHLAGTYDGSTVRLFLNGAQVASTNFTGSITTSSGALRIGGNSLWGEYFKGTIDEVRVYNRALSAAEITTDMNTAVGSTPIDNTPPTVLSLSPLNGATGVVVSANLTATFSEAMNAGTISSSTFQLRDPGGALLSGAVTYNAATRVATFDPASDLPAAAFAYYTATIKGGASGVKDSASNALAADVSWSFSPSTTAFQDATVFSGLTEPTAMRFSPDGRVFVAEKGGVIKVFASLSATTPTIFADLRTQVHNFAARGLQGLALAPTFPTDPSVYVLYSYDADIGGTAPKFGTAGQTNDPAPNAGTTGATISARLSKLTASGSVMTGTEKVLVNDWFQQFPNTTVGSIAFGPDGMLYASAGDGAYTGGIDYGQIGGNPGGDPTNEGGAVRSQDLRSPLDSVTLDGSIIRIDPSTGLPPISLTASAPTTDGNGVKSYTVTSSYFGNVPNTVRVLTPTNPAGGQPHRVMFVLPVEAGLTSLSSQYSDGLEELRLLNVPNRFNVTLVAPSFGYEPWYGDNVNDPTHRMESFIVKDLLPWTNTIEAASNTHERWLIGFSKSGNGVMDLILRNPNAFSAAACWDAPLAFTDMSAFPGMALNFGTEANFDGYEIPTLVQNNGGPFKTVNRLWLSGDAGQWTTQMQQVHNQMTSAGVLHTYVAGPARAHSWKSGWLDGAVTSLSGKTFVLSPSDLNSQRIIAYGLRSPNRFTFRPGTSEIWTGDVGWNDWEEIDRITSATDSIVRNFGWPAYEGNARQSIYDAANLPLIESLYADSTATSSPYCTYSHAAAVVTGSGEPTGASTISGLSFYSSGSYPQAFNGSLFFADSSRGRIYVMYRAPNGDPDPTNRAVVSTALNPVDLQTGPGSDLFYVDMSSGSVHRLSWVPGNRAPVPVISANPTTGPAPLTVNFSAAGSSDPDAGDTISFAWDLDNDGVFDDSTDVAPQVTFTTGGNKTVRLQVTDNHSASAIATTVINVNSGPPTAFIDTPSPSLTYKIGDSISFTGHATDSDDGTLAASAVSWQFVLHQGVNTETLQTFNSVLGGSFTVPDRAYPSYLELKMTATDSGGLQGTTSIQLNPQTANLSFATTPTGLQLSVNGVSAAAPFARTVIVGSANAVIAISPQTVGSTTYFFSNWSDSGAATHTITAPLAGGTYTATYTTGPLPVAAFNFDEASGSTVLDASTNANNGTITGATRTTSGKYNGALSFNGTSNLVTVPDSNSLDLTTAMTIEAWIFPTSGSGTRDVIIKEGSGVDIYNLYYRTDSAKSEGNVLISGSNRTAQGTPAGINTWSHLAAVYNGSTIQLYINGTSVASTATTGSITTSTGALRIGGNSLWGEWFAGMIDDVRIYNQALTATQIQTDMNTPVSSVSPGPVNHPPTAVISANPTSGAIPLPVNFSGTSSSDPDAGDTITYAWDLDNDGAFDDSTSATPSFTFTTAGTKTVRLQVTDNHGLASSIATTTITATNPNNVAPTMFIDTPSPSLLWKVGDAISFTGHATDPEDVTIPAASISWQFILHQGASTQTLQTFTGVAAGSFTVPNEPYPSYLELKGTATDSLGSTGTASIQLNPQTTTLNFATSPTGLQLTVNSVATTAPFNQTVVVNSVNPVVAAASQTQGATTYFFSNWSDAGAASHSITAPLAGGTYTATYTTAPGPVAAYNFDAGSGSTLADVSGNGNNGTITGATWSTSGKYGSALSFNGTSNLVSVADSALLHLTTGMTLEAWVFPTINTGTRDVIIKEGSGVDIYNMYARNDAGKSEGNVFVGGGNKIANGNPPAINTWTHLATTFDGSTVKLFVNGVQAASNAASGSIGASTGFLRIGGNNLWGEWFQGRIDDVRIYNRALLAAEITTDMNNAIATPLVAMAASLADASAPTTQVESAPAARTPARPVLFSRTRISSLAEMIDAV